MLSRVLQIVREQGWYDLSQPFDKTIHFTRGPSLWMRLSRQGQGGVHLKFSELASLVDEAHRSQRASQDFPALAPHPRTRCPRRRAQAALGQCNGADWGSRAAGAAGL